MKVIILALSIIILGVSAQSIIKSNQDIQLSVNQYGDNCRNYSTYTLSSTTFPSYVTVEFPLSGLEDDSTALLKIAPASCVGGQYVELSILTFASNYSFSTQQVVESSKIGPDVPPPYFGDFCTLAKSNGQLSSTIRFNADCSQSDSIDVSQLVRSAIASNNNNLVLQFKASLIVSNETFCYGPNNFAGPACGVIVNGASSTSGSSFSLEISGTTQPSTASPSPTTTASNTIPVSSSSATTTSSPSSSSSPSTTVPTTVSSSSAPSSHATSSAPAQNESGEDNSKEANSASTLTGFIIAAFVAILCIINLLK